MKMDARHLVQLATIVETGSFARAAARLSTSQPAISRDVAALEARIGMPLFDRGVRPVAPTALCLTLAEEGAAILFARCRAELTVERARAGTTGLLRVVGPPLVMDHVVTPMFASFHARHSAVEIQMQAGYAAEATALVRARRVDLAICAVEALDEDGLVFAPLMASRNVIACRLNHPLTRLPEPGLRAVLDYGWVAPPENSPLDRDLRASMASLGGSMAAVRLRSATSAGIRSYLETTDCLAILPGSVVAAMARRYDVVALPIPLPGPTRSVGLLTQADGVETRLARRMRDHLIEEFGKSRLLAASPHPDRSQTTRSKMA